MGSGAATTKRNWEALRRVTLLHFSRLHRAHPRWDFKDLQRHLALPSTRLVQEIAQEAGFGRRRLSTADENSVLRMMFNGASSPGEIARKIKVPPRLVSRFLKDTGLLHGAGRHSALPSPSPRENRGEADLPSAERRRVSRKGQFSYNGCVYSLGASYAGRVCWIEEAGRALVVHCAERPRATLPKRA